MLSTKFHSLKELKEAIHFTYYADSIESDSVEFTKSQVHLTHCSSGKQVTTILTTGISETDFVKARDGDFLDKLWLGIRCPYAAINRKDLKRIYNLARRNYQLHGEGDVAFFDLAEHSVCHINAVDVARLPAQDFTEKGYLNTFNHVTAQTFITSFFSEQLADFVADVHERRHMPELISGQFTSAQLTDPDHNAMDNYVDIVNNEWGQELGKLLKVKYQISQEQEWTPELLADYLNDIQSYYGWAFQIGFEPFRPGDEVVIRFSAKINRVMKEARVK